MSHRFKRPASIDPEERRRDRGVRMIAMQVKDQAMLDALTKGAAPQLRDAMVDRLAPYLTFVPAVPEVADCQNCGFKGGSVVPHQCMDAA